MPKIQETYRSYKDRGFDVVAIDVQESPEEVKGFLKELGLSLPERLSTET